MGPRILLIDAPNIIRRNYEAIPGEADAEQTARAGLGGITRLIEQLAPTHVLCAFDGEAPTWRHARYPAYKATRPPTPEAVREGSTRVCAALEQRGVVTCLRPGIEADDVIGSAVATLVVRGVETVIASSDQGYAQLLCDEVRLWTPPERAYRDAAWAREKFAVRPVLIPDLWALAGHGSDNIAGVPGIGPKGAAVLIDRYGDLESVIKARGEIGGKKGAAIGACEGDLLLWRELLRLRSDLKLGLNLHDARLKEGA